MKNNRKRDANGRGVFGSHLAVANDHRKFGKKEVKNSKPCWGKLGHWCKTLTVPTLVTYFTLKLNNKMTAEVRIDLLL